MPPPPAPARRALRGPGLGGAAAAHHHQPRGALLRARAASSSSSSGVPWTVLGVDRDASKEEVQAAFRRLAKQNHPDVAGPANAAKFMAMVEAYEAMLDLAQAPGTRPDPGTEGYARSRGRTYRRYQSVNDWLYPREPSVEDLASDTRSPEEMAASAKAWREAQERKKEALERERRGEEARARAREAYRKAAMGYADHPAGPGGPAYAMLVGAAASLCFVAYDVGNATAGNGPGSPVGAPASGDCRERGGGLCRFLGEPANNVVTLTTVQAPAP